MTSRNALIVRGGWDGHQPVETTDFFIPFLKEHGFEVRVEEGTPVYTDAGYLDTVDLIVQVNTMNTIEKELGGRRHADRRRGKRGRTAAFRASAGGVD